MAELLRLSAQLVDDELASREEVPLSPSAGTAASPSEPSAAPPSHSAPQAVEGVSDAAGAAASPGPERASAGGGARTLGGEEDGGGGGERPEDASSRDAGTQGPGFEAAAQPAAVSAVHLTVEQPGAEAAPVSPAGPSQEEASGQVPQSGDLRDEEPTEATPEEQSGSACKQS